MSENAVVESKESSKMLDVIQKNSIWLKINAVMYMLYGVLACLTIIGALIGIPMAWSGWKLWGSVSAAEEGRGEEAVGNICFYFKVMGIILIVGIVLMLLQFMFLGAMLGGMMGGSY